jgi:hypothetical protein
MAASAAFGNHSHNDRDKPKGADKARYNQRIKNFLAALSQPPI